MTVFRSILACLFLPVALQAHPMGNFSVNHYSRLSFRAGHADLTYVLDLAEIPAFQLLGNWKTDGNNQQLLHAKALGQAQEWLTQLSLVQEGQRLSWRLKSVSAQTTEGAGGMPVLRVSVVAQSAVQPGKVLYEDGNYPGRAGWKEIVVTHDATSVLESATPGSEDISHGLTYYPTDPGITPPQDITAQVEWSPLPSVVARPVERPQTNLPPTVSTVTPPSSPVPAATPPAAASFSPQQSTGPGSVVRGDFLSGLLQRREFDWQTILLGIAVAISLGAMHALSPGHGKTIVAAYLVGSRGTLKHAGLLGLVVTFTHTFTVFLLGLGILFFQQYVIPEKIVPLLGVVSGLSIVTVGLSLLYRRALGLMNGGPGYLHSHDDLDHAHVSFAPHSHTLAAAGPSRTRISELLAQQGQPLSRTELPAPSDPGPLTHDHGGSTHTHMIEGDITLGSLITLGVSGGLVPCPSALVLMLSAIALGRPGLGLLLLIGFSSGLALVLMGIGMLALYAKQFLPDTSAATQRPVFRLIPVFSAVVVICLGLVMTASSAGWVQPLRFLS